MHLKNLSNKSPRTLEEFLKENSVHMHENHLLMIEVQYALCLMYGNIAEYRYEGLKTNLQLTKINFYILELSEIILRRKIDLCENVLSIYDKISPGRTNHRMNIIFELNCAKIIECQVKYGKSLIDKIDAMVRGSK